MAETRPAQWRLRALSFGELPGWRDDDHAQALACFRISARRMAERPHTSKLLGVDGLRLAAIGRKALVLDRALAGDARAARQFFEEHFRPAAIDLHGGSGFVTGYFEPEVAASPVRTARFSYPLYRRPDDLVELSEPEMPDDWDRQVRFARRDGGRLVEYFDRAAIEAGALAGRGIELAWIESPVDGFFIHVQGSARLTMPTGEIRRIAYDGKSGHAFTPIGRILIERGELARADVTMQSIRDWLEAHPDEAADVMATNRSFIFFVETAAEEPSLGPVAAAAVQLSPGRSLAVDRTIHTFGTPIFVATRQPLPAHAAPFRRLMIAQDTGSAIVGPARGDLFIGSGDGAGAIAGAIRHDADFFVLLPAPGGDG